MHPVRRTFVWGGVQFPKRQRKTCIDSRSTDQGCTVVRQFSFSTTNTTVQSHRRRNICRWKDLEAYSCIQQLSTYDVLSRAWCRLTNVRFFSFPCEAVVFTRRVKELGHPAIEETFFILFFVFISSYFHSWGRMRGLKASAHLSPGTRPSLLIIADWIRTTSTPAPLS